MNAIDLQMVATIGPGICAELDKKEDANFKIVFDVNYESVHIHCTLEVMNGRLIIDGNFDWNTATYQSIRKTVGHGSRTISTDSHSEKTELESIPFAQLASMICKYRMMLENWY